MYRSVRMLELEDVSKNEKSSSKQTSSSKASVRQTSSSQASGSHGLDNNMYYSQASTNFMNSSSILGLDKYDCLKPLLKQKAKFHSSTAKHDNIKDNVLKAYKKLRIQGLKKLQEESTSDESSDTSLEIESIRPKSPEIYAHHQNTDSSPHFGYAIR